MFLYFNYIPRILNLIPRNPIPILRIPTTIPHNLTQIPRIPAQILCIPTPVPRISTQIPRIVNPTPRIPLIAFPDSPFEPLQIARYVYV